MGSRVALTSPFRSRDWEEGEPVTVVPAGGANTRYSAWYDGAPEIVVGGETPEDAIGMLRVTHREIRRRERAKTKAKHELALRGGPNYYRIYGDRS